jgi:hypothetical protein
MGILSRPRLVANDWMPRPKIRNTERMENGCELKIPSKSAVGGLSPI